MADYIYLLENRLSAPQRAALQAVREVARQKGVTVFLVGGAVRDLTSGAPVRDLDVAVQGNALKLRKDLERAGATVSAEIEAGQALFLRFPGGVRVEVGSTLGVTYPKPAKPVARTAGIQEDLRRRDFTANAMALSLNEGSYGLLIDPLNGAADIENRELRLVSNYGFIEEPVRMIRAARLMARLGWTLEEKTRTRYETGKQEGYISALNNFHRGYELEEIVHEEDPLRVMRRLEAEGWMEVLSPVWSSDRVNEGELDRLRDVMGQLDVQGIRSSGAAATFPLLTAKLSSDEVKAMKALFPRQGFVAEVDSLEEQTRDFAAQLGGKAAAQASDAWKLIMASPPDVVLWAAFSVKNPTVQARFKSFFTEWPQVRSRMPYALLAEMRITPDLPEYDALLERLFFELMDGRLGTPEEMKAFLEPYSPPAPPPVVSLRRPRAGKKEGKGKGRAKAAKAVEPEDESVDDGEASLDNGPDDLDLDSSAEAEEADDEADELEDAASDEGSDVEPAPQAKAPVPVRARSSRARSIETAEPLDTAANTTSAPAAPAPEGSRSAEASGAKTSGSGAKRKPAAAEAVMLPETPAKPAARAAKPVAPTPSARGQKPVEGTSAPKGKAAPAKAAPVKTSPVKSVPGKSAGSAKPASATSKSTTPGKTAAKAPGAPVKSNGRPTPPPPKTPAPAKATPKAALKGVPGKSAAVKASASSRVVPAAKKGAKSSATTALPAKARQGSVPAKAATKGIRTAPQPASQPAKKVALTKSSAGKKAAGRGR